MSKPKSYCLQFMCRVFLPGTKWSCLQLSTMNYLGLRWKIYS